MQAIDFYIARAYKFELINLGMSWNLFTVDEDFRMELLGLTNL